MLFVAAFGLTVMVVVVRRSKNRARRRRVNLAAAHKVALTWGIGKFGVDRELAV